MLIKIGLQNGFEGKSIAWVLDYPGCQAYGKDGSEAILKVPQALVAYQSWVGEHTSNSWMTDLGDFDVRLAEVLEEDKAVSPAINWFAHDALPLTQIEVERGLQVLTWLRADLLDWVKPLSDSALDQPFEGERWSIRGILAHVAGAEFWYLDRFGLAGMRKEDLAKDVFERLTQVRARMDAVLPELVGNAEIREVDGELWSGRKILRRAAWHEKDHIQHILRLMTNL